MRWNDTTQDRRFIMYYSEKERGILEVTDWTVRIHWFSQWFSQYTDNTTQKCQQRPSHQAERGTRIEETYRQHTPASPRRTSTYLSLSTLLKPGRMCLKLELRSSLGWLLVRFIEPFSRRLRKPWRRETETVNKTVSPLVCEGSLRDVNH